MSPSSDAAEMRYSFTTFQYPNAGFTSGSGINAEGVVVGNVQGLDQVLVHGLIKDGDSLLLFDAPGAGPLNGTLASGINHEGQVVGHYVTEPDFLGHGFLKEGDTFTTIDVPDSTHTEAIGINNLGQIVGRTFLESHPQAPQGSAFVKTGESFTFFDATGAASNFGTSFSDINDDGTVIGQFLGPEGSFSFVKSGDDFALVEVPGARTTTATGINNQGHIVGYYDEPDDISS